MNGAEHLMKNYGDRGGWPRQITPAKTFPLIRLVSYNPITFIYCWSSNFAGKVVLEREHGRRNAISRFLPCV